MYKWEVQCTTQLTKGTNWEIQSTTQFWVKENVTGKIVTQGYSYFSVQNSQMHKKDMH